MKAQNVTPGMQFAVCSSIQIRAAQTSYAPIANKISNLFLLANSKLELLRLPSKSGVKLGLPRACGQEKRQPQTHPAATAIVTNYFVSVKAPAPGKDLNSMFACSESRMHLKGYTRLALRAPNPN